MKSNILKRVTAAGIAMAAILLSSLSSLAAPVSGTTIDTSKSASLSIFKYDMTNAAKDGIWSEESFVSTGEYDGSVNSALGGGNENILGNSATSNGYAISGVQFTYLKVADILQLQKSSGTQLLYAIDKGQGSDMLSAIGLSDGKGAYTDDSLSDDNWYYTSDTLINALSSSLENNPTSVKNSLETYVQESGGTAMSLTDENGHASVSDLPLGLYLIVETKVPEMVTSTTSPFFVSLPMTSIDGDKWIYDVTVYPKNETGIVTLEKTVREKGTDIFSHNATASAGDTVEYRIISTLPTITSFATAISEYTFTDVLSKGLSYAEGNVTIEFFTDRECTNPVTAWSQSDGKFSVDYTSNDDGSHTMTISMTEAGLSEINSGENANGSIYSGYSNYTMRIHYTAIINSDSSFTYGDTGNPNEVVLTWRRSSQDYYDTLIDDCHVYSYGLNVTKQFGDGKNNGDMFKDIIFKLQNKTDGYFVTAEFNEEENIWYVTGASMDEENASSLCPNPSGELIIMGLENDEYILTEVSTADGYTLLREEICITITAIEDDSRPCDIYSKDTLGAIQNDPRYSFDGGLDLRLANIPQVQLAHNLLTAAASVDGNAVTMLSSGNSQHAIVPLTVINTQGFDLPQTGDTSMITLTIVASVFAVSTAALFLVLRHYRKKDDNSNE